MAHYSNTYKKHVKRKAHIFREFCTNITRVTILELPTIWLRKRVQLDWYSCYRPQMWFIFNLRGTEAIQKSTQRHQGQHMVKNAITFIEIWGHHGKTSKGTAMGLREIWGLDWCINNPHKPKGCEYEHEMSNAACINHWGMSPKNGNNRNYIFMGNTNKFKNGPWFMEDDLCNKLTCIINGCGAGYRDVSVQC